MQRDLFRDMKRSEGEEIERKEYNPPEEELVNQELIDRLVEIYTKDKMGLTVWVKQNFDSEVARLESIIRDAGDKLHPQLLIDPLTSVLGDESGTRYFRRTEYLTLVIQALYNLNYTDEFVVDIKDWNEGGKHVGGYLHGSSDRPIILNLHGNFYSCGVQAEHCDFIIHGKVAWCGSFAGDCGFNQMPDAEIENYLAKPHRRNILREMNENGEWKRTQWKNPRYTKNDR